MGYVTYNGFKLLVGHGQWERVRNFFLFHFLQRQQSPFLLQPYTHHQWSVLNKDLKVEIPCPGAPCYESKPWQLVSFKHKDIIPIFTGTLSQLSHDAVSIMHNVHNVEDESSVLKDDIEEWIGNYRKIGVTWNSKYLEIGLEFLFMLKCLRKLSHWVTYFE